MAHRLCLSEFFPAAVSNRESSDELAKHSTMIEHAFHSLPLFGLLYLDALASNAYPKTRLSLKRWFLLALISLCLYAIGLFTNLLLPYGALLLWLIAKHLFQAILFIRLAICARKSRKRKSRH